MRRFYDRLGKRSEELTKRSQAVEEAFRGSRQKKELFESVGMAAIELARITPYLVIASIHEGVADLYDRLRGRGRVVVNAVYEPNDNTDNLDTKREY